MNIEKRYALAWQTHPISVGASEAYREDLKKIKKERLRAHAELARHLDAARRLYAIELSIYEILHGPDPQAHKVKEWV
jgi:hypothetical protein